MSQRPFEAVVSEHGPIVMRVCRALLGPDDAQDAWSETFLSALHAYPDLRTGSNVRGWLVTIAHNRAIDQIHARDRAPRPTDALPERPVTDAATDGADDDLRAALDALAPKQRGAVVLRYLADLSYAEVATTLECSEAAARRNAADGIARLRSLYRPEPHGSAAQPARTPR